MQAEQVCGNFSLLSFQRGKSRLMRQPCCLYIPPFHLWTNQFSWNLVWTLCHWRPPSTLYILISYN